MSPQLARFKQLLQSVPESDRLSNQQWLSQQARYRAADVQAREAARRVAQIYAFRQRIGVNNAT
jgi:hypothetical protein